MAQDEARDGWILDLILRLGSTEGPQAKDCHCISSHICVLFLSHRQSYTLLCKVVAEFNLFSLGQPCHWMLSSSCVTVVIQHNCKPFKVKDAIFMPSVCCACGGAG